MNQYLKIAHKLTNFLFNLQIIFDKKEMELKKFSNNVLYAKAKIAFTKKEKHDFHFFLNKNNELFINKNRNLSTADGPYKINELFRLNPYKIIKEKKIYDFKKTKLIKRVLYQILIIIKHTYYEHLNYSNRILIKDFLNKFKRQSMDLTKGGMLCKFEINKNKLKIICHDYGGIFDYYINAEGREYTPRCMGNFYADAYSAYCFAEIYTETKDKKYLNACLMTLDFIYRTYEDYPKDVVWYHHDFKNPAYIETIFLIKEHITNTQFKKYCYLIKKLREDFYEPINVFALRLHWRSARKYHGFRDKKRRINSCIRILKKNQTKEGLIHDNNKEDYKDAHDLTYHQYSLACLASSFNYINNNKIKEIFLKGIEFSSKILLPNGEIAYNGRGANNIQYLASAIYAFKTASDILEDNKYKSLSYLMLNQLKKWQLPNGLIPVGMNRYINQRMAWNHCITPYNALVCYFLYKSSNDKNDKNKYTKEEANIMNDSGYALIKNKNYYFGFFSGCDKSYKWSDGTHITGIAGITAIGKKEPLNLILDMDIKDNILVTDLPSFLINGKQEDFYGRGKIRYQKDFLEYRKRLKNIFFLRKYYFENKRINVKTRIKILNNCNLTCDGLIKFPEFKKGIKIRNILPEFNKKTKIINSNPRGKGKIYLINAINNKDFKKNEIINYEYELCFK